MFFCLLVFCMDYCCREEPGSGKQGWVVDRLHPQRIQEQLRACVWSGNAGRSHTVPDLLASNLQAWHDVRKSPATEQGLAGVFLKKKKKQTPPAFPSLPHVVWAKFFLAVMSFFRGGEKGVIWAHCLLFIHWQSSWGWLNVWWCYFLRLLMKGCLELDENKFFIRIPKVIVQFFFFSSILKRRNAEIKSLNNCSRVLDSSTKSLFCASVFLCVCVCSKQSHGQTLKVL